MAGRWPSFFLFFLGCPADCYEENPVLSEEWTDGVFSRAIISRAVVPFFWCHE